MTVPEQREIRPRRQLNTIKAPITKWYDRAQLIMDGDMRPVLWLTMHDAPISHAFLDSLLYAAVNSAQAVKIWSQLTKAIRQTATCDASATEMRAFINFIHKFYHFGHQSVQTGHSISEANSFLLIFLEKFGIKDFSQTLRYLLKNSIKFCLMHPF